MKRSLAVKILGLACAAGVVALIAGTAQATIIVNTCTSTYVAINSATPVLSGWDTVAIMTDTQPIIVVKKYAKNLRTGVENDYMVTAISGDTIEFRITWENQGSAAADTATLADYIPSGTTYVAGSAANTEANCASASMDSSAGIVYTAITAAGTNPGPQGNGVIRFRVTVD